MQFTRLFEPITINGLKIENRITMPAMALFYTDNYSLTDRYKAFYRERAEGGAGLIIIGPAAIDRVGSNPLMLGLFDDSHSGPFRDLVEELHGKTDAKVGIQFMQQGRYASGRASGITPIAPSPVRNPFTNETPREMTADDIDAVKGAFRAAALRAKEAGFDYIEIIAGGGYLISEFLSPLTNHRTDGYGGSPKKRMRFGLEVIKDVRKALGEDFPMGIRVAGHDFVRGGSTNRESALFCMEAEKAGVNAISVTGGWHETDVPQLTGEVPPGAYAYLARGIREKVGVPVFASNRSGDPVVAEKILRSGSADLVCWGRPLMADPELPRKAGTGRANERIPCIACNQGCFDSLVSGLPIGCVTNPRAGREKDTLITKAPLRKTIFVAGGGPAGMQFALTASQRGHDVTLWEKEELLGGQLNLAGSLPGKREFLEAAKSLEFRLRGSDATIHLKTALTPEILLEKQPDMLVVATGAKPLELKIAGTEKSHVVSAWDVISGAVAHLGAQVVIVGGSATGCETALSVASLGALDYETAGFLLYHIAEKPERIRKLLYHTGRNITIIDFAERLAANVGPSTRWLLMKNLALMDVKLRPRTRLVEITERAVCVENPSGMRSIPADTVIIAAGSRSVNDLATVIKTGRTEVITIGDAKEPRKITDAIREGFDAALKA
jgi:2,4-dienoyl-CoA reductase (NADPH2)